MAKIRTSWSKIQAGDIVSFQYEWTTDKAKPMRTHTILVLNPKYPKLLKNGDTEFYINGLKLERSNRPIFKNREDAWRLLKRIGEIEVVDEKNEIYKVNIRSSFLGTYGATDRVYKQVMFDPVGRKSEYRTYLWKEAQKKGVFYEPIKLPKDKVQMLLETQGEGVEVTSRTRSRDKTSV